MASLPLGIPCVLKAPIVRPPPIHLHRSYLSQRIGRRPLQLHGPEPAAPTILHLLLNLSRYNKPLAPEGRNGLPFIGIALYLCMPSLMREAKGAGDILLGGMTDRGCTECIRGWAHQL